MSETERPYARWKGEKLARMEGRSGKGPMGLEGLKGQVHMHVKSLGSISGTTNFLKLQTRSLCTLLGVAQNGNKGWKEGRKERRRDEGRKGKRKSLLNR